VRGKKVKQARVASARLEEQVLAGLVRWWDEEKDNYTYNACILTARITSDVLKHFGLTHRVSAVTSLAMNKVRYDRLTSLAEDDDGMTFRDGEYALGAAEGNDAKTGLGGHVIVLTANDHVVDFTMSQVDRPEHQIVAGDARRITKTKGAFRNFTGRNQLTLDLEQGILYYFPADDLDYTGAPDWRLTYTTSKKAIASVSEFIATAKANA